MSQLPPGLSNHTSTATSPEIPPAPLPVVLVQSFSPTQSPELSVPDAPSASPIVTPLTLSPSVIVRNDAPSTFQSMNSPSHHALVSHQEGCPSSATPHLDPPTDVSDGHEHRTEVSGGDEHRTEASEGPPSGSFISQLRAQSLRLRVAKIRAQFEHTLLTLLMLNVIYMYYIDHKLLVLVIRGAQLIRLFYFPHPTPNSQRGTALLLLVSNIPVLLIHIAVFSSRDFSRHLGEMLFINFIGLEPKSLFKVLSVDFVTIILQGLILQCRWDPSSIYLLSALPVPTSVELLPIEEDPNITRPTEPAVEQEQQNNTEGISLE